MTIKMDTDEAFQSLLAAAQRHDRAAFGQLVERYSARLCGQIHARLQSQLRSRIGVDDILQETLLRAFESIEKFRWQGEESFYRWLASIAEHLIRNSVQKKMWGDLQIDRDVPGAREVSPSSTGESSSSRTCPADSSLLEHRFRLTPTPGSFAWAIWTATERSTWRPAAGES